MDGSNDPNNNGQQVGSQGQGQLQGQKRDLIYAERMRSVAQEKMSEARVIAEMSKPYLPYAKQMIQSTHTEQQSLFYSVMGISTERSRQGATHLFAELCAMNERELERPIAQAISENATKTLKVVAAWEWMLFAGVSAYAFRKHRQMPTAHLKGPQKYFGPTMRIVWYGFLAFGLVSPAVGNVIQLVRTKRLLRDPRMRELRVGLPEGIDPARFGHGKQNSIYTYKGQGDQSSPPSDDSSPTGSWQTDSKPSIQEQATAWRQSDTEAQNRAAYGQSPAGNYSGSGSYEPAAPIQENSAWDSPSVVDDASPVAGSASSGRSDTRPGESTWDRLRRQAGTQGRQPQLPRQSPPSQGGWGENTDPSPQFGGSSRNSRDDYSYSSADFERSTAKDQAQREFDQLLDRERQGVDQENKRWR